MDGCFAAVSPCWAWSPTSCRGHKASPVQRQQFHHGSSDTVNLLLPGVAAQLCSAAWCWCRCCKFAMKTIVPKARSCPFPNGAHDNRGRQPTSGPSLAKPRSSRGHAHPARRWIDLTRRKRPRAQSRAPKLSSHWPPSTEFYPVILEHLYPAIIGIDNIHPIVLIDK